MHALDALVEVFTWVGLGAGILTLLVMLLVRLADGVWMPTPAVLEDTADGRVARWFARDGAVGEALLTHEQARALAGRDSAEVYTRDGIPDRIRLTKGSPAVRAVALLATGLLALGALSAVASLALLFMRG